MEITKKILLILIRVRVLNPFIFCRIAESDEVELFAEATTDAGAV